LLKGKFRRLKYLDMSLDDKIPLTVSSCVELHNFILLNEKNPEPQCDLSDAGDIVPAVSEFGTTIYRYVDLGTTDRGHMALPFFLTVNLLHLFYLIFIFIF
jgi:hypothetical protein